MAVLLRPLTLFQWGKEVITTHGTAVPATEKIAVENIGFTPLDELYRPNLAKGYMLPHSANETPIVRGTTWKVSDQPLTFNQHQRWLSMAIVGGVSAVGVADPWTWTYTRNILADPTPDSFTLERRLSDGTLFNDNEWAYAMLKEISWTFEENQPLKFSAEGFARRIQSSTLTAAQAMPIIDIPPAPLCKVWLDATWATLGTTLLSGQVRQAEVTFKTGFKPIILMDGRTDLDFATHVVDGNEVGLELELTVLLTKAQYDAQKTAAEAGTLRAVRLLVDGPTVDRSITFDMLLKYDVPTFFEVDDDEGQVQGVFKMRESTDGTNLFKVIVENGIGT